MAVGKRDAVRALIGKQSETLRGLLESGVDPNAMINDDLSLLHYASSRISDRGTTVFADGVRVLLEAGADPNILDTRNNTPLHVAARAADVSTVRLLLSYGADATKRTVSGNTAVDSFVSEVSAEVLRRNGFTSQLHDVERNLAVAGNELYLLLKNARSLCSYQGDNAAIRDMRDVFKSGFARSGEDGYMRFREAISNLKSELAHREEVERNRGLCGRVTDCFHGGDFRARMEYMQSLRSYIAVGEFLADTFHVPKMDFAIFQTSKGFLSAARTGVFDENAGMGSIGVLSPDVLRTVLGFLGVPRMSTPMAGQRSDSAAVSEPRAPDYVQRVTRLSTVLEVEELDDENRTPHVPLGATSSTSSHLGAGAYAGGRNL